MVTVRKLLAFLLSVSILIPCAAGSYQAASIERAEISYSDTENYSKVFWLDEMEQNEYSGQIPEYLIEKECELDEYHTGFSVKVYYTDTGGKTTDLREVTEKLYREDKSNLSAPDKGDYIGFIGDSITHTDDTALASYEDIIYEYYIAPRRHSSTSMYIKFNQKFCLCLF